MSFRLRRGRSILRCIALSGMAGCVHSGSRPKAISMPSTIGSLQPARSSRPPITGAGSRWWKRSRRSCSLAPKKQGIASHDASLLLPSSEERSPSGKAMSSFDKIAGTTIQLQVWGCRPKAAHPHDLRTNRCLKSSRSTKCISGFSRVTATFLGLFMEELPTIQELSHLGTAWG